MNEAMVDLVSLVLSYPPSSLSSNHNDVTAFREATGAAIKSSRAKMTVRSTKVAIGSKEDKDRATETAVASWRQQQLQQQQLQSSQLQVTAPA